MTEAWERQKNESSKSYAWFQVYRDLGPNRTFEKTIEKIKFEHSETKRNKIENIIPIPTLSALKNQSTRWQWRNRTRKWDNYQDKKLQLAYDEAYNQERDSLINIGSRLEKVILQNLLELESDKDCKPTSKSHAIQSASNAFDKVTKNVRLLYGKSTEIKDSNIEADVGAEVDANVNNVNVDLTSDEFFEREINYMKELIDDNSK